MLPEKTKTPISINKHFYLTWITWIFFGETREKKNGGTF